MEQKNELNNNITNWLTQINDILNNNGFSFVFNQEFALNKNKTDKLIEAIQKRSKEIFEQKLFNQIKNKGEKSKEKLVFYSKIKFEYSKTFTSEL